MSGKIRIMVLCVSFTAVCTVSVAAGGILVDKPLVTIDGQVFTVQDFKQWWKYWQQDSDAPPMTPEPFIDWQLLVQEAKRLRLYQQPSFRRKMGVFLKLRSLLLFKNEEIDAQIIIDDRQLQDYYDREFSPRTFLQILHFNDLQTAEQASEDLRSEHSTMKQYQDRLNYNGSQTSFEEKMMRPREVDPEWRNVLADKAIGEVSSPLPWGDGYVVLRVRCWIWFDRNDFSSLKSTLTEELKKIREIKLHEQLMKSLQEKYHVRIDEQKLAQADLYDIESIYSEMPIVTSDRGNITLGRLVEKVRSEQQFFQNFGQEPKQIERLKKETLDRLLSQELLTWAALDRHYENVSPLKESYRYYTNYRLIRELKQQNFMKGTEVSEADIANYYNGNKEDFIQPEKVFFAVLRYQGDHIGRLWAEMLTGGDFFAIAEKYGLDRPMAEEAQSELLPSPMSEKIKELDPGEIAEPYYDKGKWVLIKLVDRQAAGVEPMEQAAPEIAATLRKAKCEQKIAAFLEQRKSNMAITVNEDVWLMLHGELVR